MSAILAWGPQSSTSIPPGGAQWPGACTRPRASSTRREATRAHSRCIRRRGRRGSAGARSRRR
eukprot:14061578-Alexandrium_andersonii.AAC.1